MHWLDWTVLLGFFTWIIYDGLKRTKDSTELEGYFLAKRSIPWWAAGISVMATQLSAITMIGTTGQGYTDGFRFIQFYFALPVAMIMLSVTLVPFFYRSGVYTAYEYLERRFDPKTRSLTSLLFLFSRGMSCGAVIAAPAVVLSLVLGWNITVTALAITVPAVVYTMFGGVQAVTWTDVKIMFLVVGRPVRCDRAAVLGLPDGVGVGDGLSIAAATGRLRTFDFSFDLTNQYTFWSGTIAALFLFLSYFGTDQSQVQRYLTARSVERGAALAADERVLEDPASGARAAARRARLRVLRLQSAAADLQQGPHERMEASASAPAYSALKTELDTAYQARREAATTLATARHGDDAAAVDAAKTAMRDSEAAMQDVRSRAAALVAGIRRRPDSLT